MIYLYANENSTAFVELETVTDAKFFGRPHNAVIRIYVEAGNVIERTSTRAISKSGEAFPQGIKQIATL